MGLSNDDRGWVMASVSGVACIIGASIICVDIIIRKFPSKRNFRIQDSDTFLSSSLSLSFGVMLFSALFSMMPSARSSLQKGGMSPKAAAWTLIGCFLAGALGIQVISRLAHLFMPSHVVDCEHSHDEEAAVKEPTEEDGRVRHEQAHPPYHDRSHGVSNQTIKQHGEHVHIQRPKIAPRKSTSAAADQNGTATLPPGKSLSRRPSLQARLSQTLSSIASRSKSSCDCDGPCYGFSEPCGADCFKNMQTRQASTRSIIRQQLLRGESNASEQTPLLQDIREEVTPRPEQQNRMASDTALQTKRSNGMLGLSTDAVIEEEEDSQSLHHTKSHASLASNHQHSGEQQHHHHHVPTNVFASIGIQTSIAIALHKLPEGFITFATNHANPKLGFAVFLALFIHNITDGFVLALPLYLAINNRAKAMFWASLLGGASQPLGAGLAALIFKIAGSKNVAISENFYGAMFAVTAGIMTSVALQLFGESLELTHNRSLCMIFAFVGMGILGCSSALTA
ncbi:Zinc/iron permease, partial [Aureobasidium melanogenum]|uniref:Zinc/iron permease n=1 Tax=Aureobasidium melanogenum (strain CBS 110374) TaxID=1043003 RepID=A0A074W3X5_AURM1